MAIDYNFVDPGAIQDAASQRLTSQFNDRARLTAGNAVAAGDYGAGSRALLSSGQINDGLALQAQGKAQADDTASRSALTDYAAGNYNAAKTGFAKANNLQGVTAADTGQKAYTAAHLQVMAKLANALDTDHKAGIDPATSFDKAAPIIASLFPDSSKDLPQYRAAFLANPQGVIDTVRQATQKEMEAFTLGDGQTRFDGKGKPIATADPKTEYKTVKNADGSEALLKVGGPGSESPAPGGAAAAPGGVHSSAAAPNPVVAQVAPLAAAAGAKPADTAYLTRLAQVESAGNQNAQNGSSTGLYQFHPDTFASVGGKDIRDPADQTKAALALSQRDRQALQANGIEPNDANTYIMHQQGAGGGMALLKAPSQISAVAVLTPVYGNEKLAKQAIVNNGGSADMTAGQFVDHWRQKWGESPARAGVDVPTATQAPADAPPGVKVLYTGQGDDNKLDDKTVDYVAHQYMMTGTLPPLGMGKAAASNRDKILNRAAEIETETGATGADAVTRHLAIKSSGAALTQNTKTLAAVSQFENTASKNADLMLSLALKGGSQTGAPVINRWLQAGRKQIAGDPDVSNFDIALGTFADEYAKIVSGATGAQGSTDASRREAYDRLSKYATQGQLQSGIATMKKEMANRIQALQDQQSTLTETIRNGGVAPKPAASPTSGPAPTPPAIKPPHKMTDAELKAALGL